MGLWGKSSAKPLATSTQKCPSGRHAMSVGWTKCPYCEAESKSGEKTRINDVGAAGAGYAEPPAPSARPGPTRINHAVEPADDQATLPDIAIGGGHRETKILPEAAEAGFAPARQPASFEGGAAGVRGQTRVLGSDDGAAPTVQAHAQRRPNGGRKLTGIVVTFSWAAQGRLFEVHEGRNYGGSGTVASEGHRDADFMVTDDTTMSSTHFLILCQGGKYRISDCNSTNGTFVEGELVDALGIDLVDGARIQAGATLMVFKKIVAPTPVAPPAAG